MTPRGGRHVDVLVVGGGNGGISLAARLKRLGVDEIAIVEPKLNHQFRPLLSYVGAGLARPAELTRTQASVMPGGVEWVQDAVEAVDPVQRTVMLASGASLTYDQLCLTPGSEPDWEATPGSAEAMLSPAASTNYVVDLAPKTWQLIRQLRAGRAIFTLPDGPAPCPGAGQKVLYMACDYWRSQGVLNDIDVTFVTPDSDVSANASVSDELRRWTRAYGITVLAKSRIERIDPVRREVHIAGAATERLKYDFLHVTPVHRAQPWIGEAGLSSSAAAGYVDIDPHTLRHERFDNVWACGDAAETGASRSGGALREQTEVLAANLIAARAGEELTESYSGYSVCPYTVSRSKVLFFEFDRQRRRTPKIPLLWQRPNRLMYFGDRRVLPQIYWRQILKGK
ncbi:MAG: FAD/NAD(P)-binding oxidoreductase [Ornithinimicrobium sp.]